MRDFSLKPNLLVLLFLTLAWQTVNAQNSWTASVHVGAADVNRLVKDSGPWWSDVDDEAAALGVSLAYDLYPMLGFRVMYEQANGLDAVSECPPGIVCAAVIIREEVDFRGWHAAVVPRYEFARDWFVFGTVGAKRWKLEREDILPDDSGTEFTYGAGITWQAIPRVEGGLEYQNSEMDYDAIRLNLGYRF